MHEILTKYFKGQLSAEEKAALFDKIKTDRTWQTAFTTMQNLYGLTSWLPTDNDEAESIDRLLDFKLNQKKKVKLFPWKNLTGYAAAILISVACTTSVIFLYFRGDWGNSGWLVEDEDIPVTYEEFSVPPGQRAMVKLHDGTTVWLNARTTIRYPNHFSEKDRRVELNGEAYFEVKENKDKPFIISTEKLDMKVTGTSFNVFAYHGQPEFNTSLIEGSLLVYTKNNESNGLLLNANERAILAKNKLFKEPFTQMDFLLWKDGIYAFDDLPFDVIKKKLELYYDVCIVVNNQSFANYKFSGKFRQRDGIESVLRTLQKIRKFKFTKDDEKNVITIM